LPLAVAAPTLLALESTYGLAPLQTLPRRLCLFREPCPGRAFGQSPQQIVGWLVADAFQHLHRSQGG
jgi:hypothetical protein